MEILREDPAARYLLAALIVLAINVILIGELYLLAVLLDGRRWLRTLARGVLGFLFLSSFTGVAALFLLAPLGGVYFYEAPGPPSRTLLQVTAFNALLAVNALVAILLYYLARRLAGLEPRPMGPLPRIRWGRLLSVPAIVLGIGLVIGLLIGSIPGESNTVPVPLLPWPLAVPVFILSLVWAPYLGVVAACSSHIRWRLERLSPARFTSVGIWLTLAGSFVLGVAFWLVP